MCVIIGGKQSEKYRLLSHCYSWKWEIWVQSAEPLLHFTCGGISYCICNMKCIGSTERLICRLPPFQSSACCCGHWWCTMSWSRGCTRAWSQSWWSWTTAWRETRSTASTTREVSEDVGLSTCAFTIKTRLLLKSSSWACKQEVLHNPDLFFFFPFYRPKTSKHAGISYDVLTYAPLSLCNNSHVAANLA